MGLVPLWADSPVDVTAVTGLQGWPPYVDGTGQPPAMTERLPKAPPSIIPGHRGRFVARWTGMIVIASLAYLGSRIMVEALMEASHDDHKPAEITEEVSRQSSRDGRYR